MSRRIEIELTSSREDGSFTWRAAGAREPKGFLTPELAPEGVKVGNVLRVEIEADIDGISVLSVLPPRDKHGPAGLIEVKGTTREAPGVTTNLLPKGERPRRSRFFGDEGDDRPRRPGGRGSRPGPGGDRERRPDGDARQGDARPTGDGQARGPRRAAGDARPARFPAGPPRDTVTRSGPGERSGRPPRTGPPSGERPGGGERPATRTRPRFVPGTKHRDDVLATLPEEQRPIADQIVAGGLPAVRRALAEQPKDPGVALDSSNNAVIIALAEQMLPAIKEAIWLDRAEAAAEQLDHLSLRELRTTVVGALPRDDHGREIDRKLRDALEERVTRLRDGWHADMTRALDEGRVLQALRLSTRPPEPAARFPATLVAKLSEATGAAMAADTPPERWLALLEAATASPVRRYVKPAGIPSGADENLLKTAGQAAGRIPALAALLGMSMPPPPGPVGAGVPVREPRRPSRGPRTRTRRAPGDSAKPEGAATEHAPPSEVSDVEAGAHEATGIAPPPAEAAAQEAPVTQEGSIADEAPATAAHAHEGSAADVDPNTGHTPVVEAPVVEAAVAVTEAHAAPADKVAGDHPAGEQSAGEHSAVEDPMVAEEVRQPVNQG